MHISYLMPVWNGPEEWLREAIDSVLAQTDDRWELCICDDGSTDERVDRALQQYDADYSQIRIVRKKHRGISAASNAALDLATGVFCAYFDSNDWLKEDATSILLNCIQDHPEVDVIVGGGPLRVYRATLLRALDGLRSKYDGAQDGDLALRAADVGARPFKLDAVLQVWRGEPQGFHKSAGDASDRSHAAARKRRGLKEEVELFQDGLPKAIGTPVSIDRERD